MWNNAGRFVRGDEDVGGSSEEESELLHLSGEDEESELLAMGPSNDVAISPRPPCALTITRRAPNWGFESYAHRASPIEAPKTIVQPPRRTGEVSVTGTSTDNLGTRTKNLSTRTKNLGTRTKKLGTRTKKLGTRTKNLGTHTKNLGTHTNNLDTRTNVLR